MSTTVCMLLSLIVSTLNSGPSHGSSSAYGTGGAAPPSVHRSTADRS
ncbi:hypothetical protein [Streptomyces xanthochromogenes]